MKRKKIVIKKTEETIYKLEVVAEESDKMSDCLRGLFEQAWRLLGAGHIVKVWKCISTIIERLKRGP